MSHDRNGRDRHRRWRGWNDWGFFGIPYPYPYTTAQYVLPSPVAAPICPPCPAPLYTAPATNIVTSGPGGLLDGGFGTALGFKPRKIRGHKKRTVVARPEVIFQATELRIPHDVAKHFDIYEIRIGNLSLLASRDPIPAELFSNEGCGFPLMTTDFPPVVPGQHIFLKVKNRSGSSHRFRAGFVGRALI